MELSRDMDSLLASESVRSESDGEDDGGIRLYHRASLRGSEMDSAPEATSPQLPIGSTPRQESPTAAPAPNNSDRNNSDRAAATTSRRPLDWVSHEAKVESKVLHVRNLPPDVLKCHYEDLLAQFGPVEVSVQVKNKNQALVQMATLEGAKRALEASQRSPPLRLGDWVLKVGYSNSQQLKLAHRPPGASTVSVKSTRYDQILPDRGNGYNNGSSGDPYHSQRRGPPLSDGSKGNYTDGGTPFPWRNAGSDSNGPSFQRPPSSLPPPSPGNQNNHSSSSSSSRGGGSYPNRMPDAELMQRVGFRSELDPKTVVLFRAAGDYFALIGEDPFKGPGRLPLNINEREELEQRTIGPSARGSRHSSSSACPTSSSLQTPQPPPPPPGHRGVNGPPPLSRGSGAHDGDSRNMRGWDEGGHGRSPQEGQQFSVPSFRNRDRSRSRDRPRTYGERSRSRERMYQDRGYERS